MIARDLREVSRPRALALALLRALVGPSVSPNPPAFLRHAFDVDELDREEGIVVALDHEGTIVWTNRAWQRFASDNEGIEVAAQFGLGRRYLDGISGPLRPYFEAVFENVLATQEPFEQDYECSSPDTFRLHHVRILPIDEHGLLIEHSARASHPHGEDPEIPTDAAFRDDNGMLLQCSNCRRVHCIGDGWHWVREWVKTPPASTTHGLCAACAGHYFATTRRSRRASRSKKASP